VYKVTIDNIGSVYSGGTPKTNVAKYWDGDIVWVTPKDLSEVNSVCITDSARKLTKSGLQKSSAQLIPAGSVVLSSRAPIGYVAIVDVDFATNQGCKSLKPADSIYNKYVYYYLKSQTKELNKRGSGTTFLELSKAAFSNFEIPICPLPEQKRIVAKIESLFSRLDNAKDSLLRVRQEIKRYRQAVLKAAFEGKVFPRLHYSEINLGKLVSIRNERKDPQDVPNMQYIGMADVEGFTGMVSKCLFAKEMKALAAFFRAGDILYGRLRPYLNKVVAAKSPGVASTEFIVMIPETGVSADYIAWRLRTKDFVDFATSLNNGDRPRVKFEQISSFNIKTPESKEQVKIVQAIESRFERAKVLEDAVEQGLEKIEQLKQSILKKAFKGKLVEPDPKKFY